MKILLNSKKNIASVNVDTYQKLEISNTVSELTEYDIRNALSATEVFDAEREANDIYRIYGRIEYLSLLNGMKSNYTALSNFFLPQVTGNTKNIFNSFKFYLVKAASSGYTKITGNSTQYVRYFDVIANPSSFELFNAGYTTNVYGDQIYSFCFNQDFDVTPYIDAFKFPATELFLYAKYVPSTNGANPPIAETFSGTSWGVTGVAHKVQLTQNTINVGDRIYGDLIEYSKPLFFQTQLSPQTYYISTPYFPAGSAISSRLQWKYNPFIPFRLRYFSDSLNEVNTGSTTYEQQISIPFYATNLGDGNFVWKDILPQGFIDPLFLIQDPPRSQPSPCQPKFQNRKLSAGQWKRPPTW